jgi:hypothetical protein
MFSGLLKPFLEMHGGAAWQAEGSSPVGGMRHPVL